jgi:hypothetical protein
VVVAPKRRRYHRPDGLALKPIELGEAVVFSHLLF